MIGKVSRKLVRQTSADANSRPEAGPLQVGSLKLSPLQIDALNIRQTQVGSLKLGPSGSAA